MVALSHLSPSFELTLDEKIEVASDYILDAFYEAANTGIDGDVVAHTAIYNALNHLIGVYGEDTVADFMRDIPSRVVSGEFSGDKTKH